MKNKSTGARSAQSRLAALTALLTPPPARAPRKDARTDKQLSMRAQFANLMTMSTVLADIIRVNYELKPARLSGQNMFVKHNLNKIYLYLPKELAEMKGCAAAPYNISEGTLEPIATNRRGNGVVTSLRLPEGFCISEATTVGQVSQALSAADLGMQRGDKLSIVRLKQSTRRCGHLANVPATEVKEYELELDFASRIPFYTLIPEELFAVEDGRVVTSGHLAEGAVAYIHKRRCGSKTLVSTQQLVITGSGEVCEHYSGEAGKRRAVESYRPEPVPYYDPDWREERDEETGKKEAKPAITEPALSPPVAAECSAKAPERGPEASNTVGRWTVTVTGYSGTGVRYVVK